jgi:hypothetical protein
MEMVMFGLGKAFKDAMRSILEWTLINENQAKEADYGNTISTSKPSRRPLPSGVKIAASSDIEDNNRGFNFTVYNATGGKVIQIQAYDPIKDRTTSSLYIVTDKEDLGEELALIITKETLSR